MLQKLSEFIVKARYYLFGLFILFAIASVIMMLHVGVNYNMVKYLPDDSKTKISLNVMEDEFGSVGSASVMISGVSVEQANEIASGIASIEGVGSAIFDGTNSSYYNEGKQTALIKLFLSTSDYDLKSETTLKNVEKYVNGQVNNSVITGSAVSASYNRNAGLGEMSIILLVAVVVVLGILFLTSMSYIEPLIFLIVIGVAILINMGTNLFLGEISFITKSISAVMLIALEMDYSIVLMHRYREEKQKRGDKIVAMKKAIAGSFVAVVSSSLTVMAGLVALMFMDFSIGFDIGMVLAKGVFISILAVIFFMPAIIIFFDNLIEKTKHKSFLPNMSKVGAFAKKTKYVMPIIFLCLVVVAVCLQSSVNFTYVIPDGQSIASKNAQVERVFGKQNPLVVLMGKNELEKQREIANYVLSYKDENGNEIINSSNALILTSAYDKVSSTELVSKGLSSSTVSAIFNIAGKSTVNETVYNIDVVKYLAQNEGVLENDFRSTINTSFNTLYEMVAKQNAKSRYDLTDEQISAIYMSADKVPHCNIIMYIVSNKLPASKTTPVLTLYGIAGKQYTVDMLKEQFYLSDEEVAFVYTTLHKNQTEKVYYYELVKLIYENNLIPSIAGKMQANYVASYNQFLYGQSMLTSENLSRMIFNINLSDDNKTAIKFLNDLDNELSIVCGDNEPYYIACNTYNVIGMSQVFDGDKTKTDLITLFAILLIVLIAFRSLSVPVILVLAIQGAIWINLGVTVLDGSDVFFVCYLIAMAIQMGATIDYGILLTDRYIFARRNQNKYDAITTSIDKSFVTVITSGSILVIACFIIHFISSIPLIADIGLLIGRGAFISIITILFVLPQLLLLFDKVIEKTSKGAKFLNNEINNKK